MYRYGILLTSMNDGREAGYFSISDNGMIGFRCGEIPWDDDVYEEALALANTNGIMKSMLSRIKTGDILQKLSDSDLIVFVYKVTYWLNLCKLTIRGHRVKAQAITFFKNLETYQIPFYEKKYKYDIRWALNFRENPLLGHMRFKVINKNYRDLYSIPDEMIDVVSEEEFATIERDRIPLFFVVTHASMWPSPDYIDNFFNGDKLAAVIAKSGGGCIHGLSLYFIPHDIIQREGNAGVMGFNLLTFF